MQWHRLTLEVAHWFEDRVPHRSSIQCTDVQRPAVFFGGRDNLHARPYTGASGGVSTAYIQHGEGVWPIAYVVMAHELSSGAAVRPEIGAMYGEKRRFGDIPGSSPDEALPPKSIIMADAGYGIFSTAYHAHRNGHNSY